MLADRGRAGWPQIFTGRRNWRAPSICVPHQSQCKAVRSRVSSSRQRRDVQFAEHHACYGVCREALLAKVCPAATESRRVETVSRRLERLSKEPHGKLTLRGFRTVHGEQLLSIAAQTSLGRSSSKLNLAGKRTGNLIA